MVALGESDKALQKKYVAESVFFILPLRFKGTTESFLRLTEYVLKIGFCQRRFVKKSQTLPVVHNVLGLVTHFILAQALVQFEFSSTTML